LRAKDKSFNADFKTDFTTNLPKIKVVPQDIGRVMLNLLNNAFYAVNERNKIIHNKTPVIDGKVDVLEKYIPLVTISTKNTSNAIEIIIKDNGTRIPQEVINKIFQPFFTTKPTDYGTGLGLSLAYDIVKAHGGEIKVAPGEKEGTVFIVSLPI
jgi:signal transduction histidine kinase